MNELKELEKYWESKTDKERWEILINNRGNSYFPVYEINIDNDDVFLSFLSEEDKDDPIILQFDEFGYYALKELLDALNIPADFV